MPKFRSVNDILDFAIERENEAHDFYMGLAQLVADAKLRDVIKGFAIDELQHGIRLEAIKAGDAAFDEEALVDFTMSENAGHAVPTKEMSYADLLLIAMNQEKAAFRLYTNLASIAQKKEFRETLLNLAKEEAQHKLRLEIEYDWNAF